MVEAGAGDVPGGALRVEFCGDIHELAPGRSLVFGRGAELDIDTNPRLHRQLGALAHRDGWWWLDNLGRSIAIHLTDPVTGATAVLPAGTRTVLASQDVLVSFEVGPTRYELRLTQAGLPAVSADGQNVSMTSTTIHEDLPLNIEQRQLLAVLCESKLRDPTAPLELPKNREIAERLDWPTTKFNRKLDWLCLRYARQGVAGLQAAEGRAPDRRRRLAEWVLANGVVTSADLEFVPRQK